MIEINNIHAGYGRFTVLHGVSTKIESGDCRVIIGPNGAGKSTTLRSLFGLLKPSAGSITLDGEDITGLPPKGLLDRGVAFVPQQPSIFSQLSVRDNLEMGLFQTARANRNAVNDIFDRFPLLAKRSETQAQALSGGERRLLELARALMIRPKVLMLDEPSLGLSPVMMERVLAELSAINQSGVTVILVEQRVKAAMSIAKTISVLRLGKIVQEGTALDAADPNWLSDAIYGGQH